MIVCYWTDVLRTETNKDSAVKSTPLFEYIRNSLIFEADTDAEQDASNDDLKHDKEDLVTNEPEEKDHSQSRSTPAKQSKITDHFSGKTINALGNLE